MLDRASDIVEQIRDQREVALHNVMETWYKRRHPPVAEANGRHYLSAIDDLKDHLPMRTVGMSYLVYREAILPLGKWYEQAQAVRNGYAEAHGLHPRTETFQWEDTRTLINRRFTQ